jgi:hypothetical protein
MILVEHGFQTVWIEGGPVYGIFRDGGTELLAKHLLELPDLHGFLPNIFDILHLLLFLEPLLILPINTHLNGVSQNLSVGIICAFRIANALVFLEGLRLLREMGLGVVKLIRGFEAVFVKEIPNPLLPLNLIMQVLSELLLHLLPFDVDILLAWFILRRIALVTSDLGFKELLSFSLGIFVLFHAPLFQIHFIIVLFMAELCELTLNKLRILKFVIPCQVVRLFPIIKSLSFKVFEESFEGVKLGSVHGRLLFHMSIRVLLTIDFLLVVGDPRLHHQGVNGRFLWIDGEVIFEAPAVRVLTSSGLLDLG